MEVKILYWKDIQSMVDVQYEHKLPTTKQQIKDDYAIVKEYDIPDVEVKTYGDWFEITDELGSVVTPDTFFEIFNMDDSNPLATPEGQKFIRDSGVKHTSMSCGDIVSVDDSLYVCIDVGWRKIN